MSSENTNLSHGDNSYQAQSSEEISNQSYNVGSSATMSNTVQSSSSQANLSSENVDINTNLADLMTEAQFLEIFPIIDPANKTTYSACHQKHITTATYDGFKRAIANFPTFLNEGSLETRKRELVAFFGNVAKETTGGWATAPGGYEAWGLCFVEEAGYVNGGIGYTTSNDPDYQAVSGKSYHGRGPIQLSYPYNYGPFSEAIYGDKSILLNNPEKLLTDGEAFWASAIWFWMTEAVSPGLTKPNGEPSKNGYDGKYYKPSNHMVMTETWTPRSSDVSKNRTFGLGTTINVINGGLECGGSWDDRGKGRVKYYKKFADIIGVDYLPAGETETNYLTCSTQTSFSNP